MIAKDCITLLQCPTCEHWFEGFPDDTGIVRGRCQHCEIDLAFGHEQQLENGTFKGKSWTE